MNKTFESKKENDKYWEHTYYIFQQLLGLYNGYYNSIENDKKIDFYDFLILPTEGDLLDIMSY